MWRRRQTARRIWHLSDPREWQGPRSNAATDQESSTLVPYGPLSDRRCQSRRQRIRGDPYLVPVFSHLISRQCAGEVRGRGDSQRYQRWVRRRGTLPIPCQIQFGGNAEELRTKYATCSIVLWSFEIPNTCWKCALRTSRSCRPATVSGTFLSALGDGLNRVLLTPYAKPHVKKSEVTRANANPHSLRVSSAPAWAGYHLFS